MNFSKNDKKSAGGVRFNITAEMIREYRKMPPDARLAWLEQANMLSNLCLTPKRRRVWEKFRAGDI